MRKPLKALTFLSISALIACSGGDTPNGNTAQMSSTSGVSASANVDKTFPVGASEAAQKWVDSRYVKCGDWYYQAPLSNGERYRYKTFHYTKTNVPLSGFYINRGYEWVIQLDYTVSVPEHFVNGAWIPARVPTMPHYVWAEHGNAGKFVKASYVWNGAGPDSPSILHPGEVDVRALRPVTCSDVGQ